MHAVLLVPGIMATRLNLGAEEVWPPTPLETKTKYRRIEKLRDDSVRPGALIDNVLCFNFYSTIKKQLGQLGFENEGAGNRQYDFPYDWRKDLFETVEVLASRIAEIADDYDKITLVGHSMGGLLCRLLLESGRFRLEPWFAKIDAFIALAVPHLGAPLALARIFGIDSTLGVSGKDFSAMANDVRYPSGYQLLPAPGEAACWNQKSPSLEPLDFYDPTVARQLGMNPDLVARAAAMHEVLDQGSYPVGVRYFYFAGTAHRTVTRVNVFPRPDGEVVRDGSSIMTKTRDGGDGTVPLYSALPRVGQRQVVAQEHATVFRGTPFRKVFFRLLGGNEGAAVEAAGLAPSLEVSLSVERPVFSPDETVEVVLAIGDPANAEAISETELAPKIVAIDGLLLLHAMDDDGKPGAEPVRQEEINYNGPSLDRMRFDLAPPDGPGHYRLSFKGTVLPLGYDPVSPENTPIAFAVAEV